MSEYKYLEDDVVNMVDKLYKMRVIKYFEADDVSNLLIKRVERYKHTKVSFLSKKILPILFSLVASSKLKLSYIAICTACQILVKESSEMDLMVEDVYCQKCDMLLGHNTSQVKVVERFTFTSKPIK